MHIFEMPESYCLGFSRARFEQFAKEAIFSSFVANCCSSFGLFINFTLLHIFLMVA